MILEMINIAGVWVWEREANKHTYVYDETSNHLFDSMHYMFSGLNAGKVFSTPRSANTWINPKFIKTND